MATFHIHNDYNNEENIPPKTKSNFPTLKNGAKKFNQSQYQRVAFNPLNQIIPQRQETTKCANNHNNNNKKAGNDGKKLDLPKDILGIVAGNHVIKSKPRSIQADNHELIYEKEIWQYLYSIEKNFQPNPRYMLKQMYINWDMRSILIDWLTTVALEYKMNENTLHLSVNYIDRFLSNISVIKEKFQLVGATAMMLAGKVDEIYPPDTKEWSYLTGDSFTVHQILKMEQFMLKVLQFNMQPPTALDFIRHLCVKHNMDKRILHLAMYLSELSLLEGRDYLQHYPSEVAASSVALARYTLFQQEPWDKKLEESVGLSLRQLSPVLKKQQKTFKTSPFREEQAIHQKYKSEKYDRVALLQPRGSCLFDDDDDDEEN